MVVSDVIDGCVVAAGFGQPKEGIPNLLRGTSMPGLILWKGNVRTFQMPLPDLASFDETEASFSCTFVLELDSEGRCLFLRDDFSSNVTLVVITFSDDPCAHAASRLARLAAATPCSPYVARRRCMFARDPPTECELAWPMVAERD